MTEPSLQEQLDMALRLIEVQATEIATLQTVITRICAKIGLDAPTAISNVGKITIQDAAYFYDVTPSCIRRWLENKRKKIKFEIIKGITWISIDTLPPRAADLQARRPLTPA
jgi:hypothetical protein